MSRAKKPPRHSRAELLILVKQQLERAGEHAISTDELLTALAPTGISRRTLERILSDLRTKHDANLSTSGKRRRWRLESPLPLPLDAPDPKDIIALRYAIAMAKPHLPLDLGDRLTTLDERLDERVRNYAASSDLPHHNALTSSSTHRMKTDARVVDQLLLACRRQTVRILYVSPWNDPRAPKWQEIEPWALEIRDAAYYLRAWSKRSKHARTFTVAHISGVETRDEATPRHPIPAQPWAEERKAYGIDEDRPGIAAVRLRGGVARWVASMIWHAEQQDVWLEPGELLERTLRYNSCREITRLLVTVLDGIVSIEPPELRDELVSFCARAQTLLP